MSYYGGPKGPWLQYLELRAYSGKEERYASIVQALAAVDEDRIVDLGCIFCAAPADWLDDIAHTPDCAWRRARAEFPQDPSEAEAKWRREYEQAMFMLARMESVNSETEEK